jgi:hypothetical protein
MFARDEADVSRHGSVIFFKRRKGFIRHFYKSSVSRRQEQSAVDRRAAGVGGAFD